MSDVARIKLKFLESAGMDTGKLFLWAGKVAVSRCPYCDRSPISEKGIPGQLSEVSRGSFLNIACSRQGCGFKVSLDLTFICHDHLRRSIALEAILADGAIMKSFYEISRATTNINGGTHDI